MIYRMIDPGGYKGDSLEVEVNENYTNTSIYAKDDDNNSVAIEFNNSELEDLIIVFLYALKIRKEIANDRT